MYTHEAAEANIIYNILQSFEHNTKPNILI